MNPELKKLAEVVVRLPIVTTPNSVSTAKDLLQNAPEDCSAAAVYASVRSLYGINILLWEPESIWLTLEKDGIELSNVLRNKLLTAIALQLNPAFYWDSFVFQTTTQALNDVVFNPEVLQENNPAHMAWAIYEASIIRGMDPDGSEVPDFDEDVQVYTAICLKRAGYVIPPEDLSYAENALKIHSTGLSQEFKKEVQNAWDSLDKNTLQEREFTETALDIQLAKLASTYLYVQGRAQILAEALLQLQS